MQNGATGQPPPLQGCLYCHSEGTTELTERRRFLGFRSSYPALVCRHCHAVAWLDIDPLDRSKWRIRYRRVDRSSRFYYVAIHLGNAGWLSGPEALAISTDGYIQRRRVSQAQVGDLGWLQPAPLQPPLPSMDPEENVYLTLRAVSYQKVPPRGFWARPDQGELVDSGKFYLTDRKMHLLGQRRDWTHGIGDIESIAYDERSWTIVVNAAEQWHQFRGMNVSQQMDAQLIATVVETLWLGKQSALTEN